MPLNQTDIANILNAVEKEIQAAMRPFAKQIRRNRTVNARQSRRAAADAVDSRRRSAAATVRDAGRDLADLAGQQRSHAQYMKLAGEQLHAVLAPRVTREVYARRAAGESITFADHYRSEVAKLAKPPATATPSERASLIAVQACRDATARGERPDYMHEYKKAISNG